MLNGKRHFDSSDQLLREMRAEVGSTILAFSCGKDALAAWIALERSGFEVHPYFMELVPGLSFIRAALERYEKIFGVPVKVFPHPWRNYSFQKLVFQPPDREGAFGMLDLDYYTGEDLDLYMRDEIGRPDLYTATGVRMADSLARYTGLKHHGVVNHRTQKWHCIFDWKMDRLEQEIITRGAWLTDEYLMFGRTFDGIDYRFLSEVKKRYPVDYETILQYYPLVDLELYRRGL